MNNLISVPHNTKFILVLLSTIAIAFIGSLTPSLNNEQIGLIFLLLVMFFLLLVGKLFFSILIILPYVYILSQIPDTIFEYGRWLMLAACCITGLAIILRNKYPLKSNTAILALFLIGLFSILISYESYYPIVSILKGLSLILLACCLLCVLSVINFQMSGEIRNKLIKVYVIMALVVVISNFLYYLYSPSTSFILGRFRGWFTNPNGIGAMYGIFFIPLIYSEVINDSRYLYKVSIFIMLILTTIHIVMSQSRAGILAAITGIIIFHFFRYKYINRLKVVFIIVTVISLLYTFTPNNVIQRYVYRNEPEVSGSSRLLIWQDLLQNIEDRPWLGTGLGVSDTGITGVDIVYKTGGYTQEKSNSYLAMLEELGVVGTSIFVLLVLLPLFRIMVFTYRSNNETSHQTNAIFIAIVWAGLVNAMFEAWILSAGSIIALSFWIFLSLLFVDNEGVINNTNNIQI